MLILPNGWGKLLENEIKKEYFIALSYFVEKEYNTKAIYPPQSDLFNAFELTPYRDVKVVILGQDPYHQKGQSHGLCFSVKQGIKIPPSLRNIFQEISTSLQSPPPQTGDLSAWAKQGVLLLNAILTVQDSKPLSHKNKGWESFTNHIVSLLNEHEKPIVFMLWGNDAKKKLSLITNPKHMVLTAVHPSPLSASRGFFGCNHFKLANEFLEDNYMKPIKWV